MVKDRLIFSISCLGLFLLPTLSHISFAGFLGITLIVAASWPRSFITFLWSRGFILLSILLLLSTFQAQDRAEAYLNLGNYLPFFTVMAALAIWLPQTRHPLAYIREWMYWFLAISVPLNGLAMVEYGLMDPNIMAKLVHTQGFSLFYLKNYNFGHRADLLFGHPNAFACYLLFVFALGLGLTSRCCLLSRMTFIAEPKAQRGLSAWFEQRPWTIYAATYLNLVGLFCTGSRNGIWVAVLMFVIATMSMAATRSVIVLGLTSVLALLLSVVGFGIGGRTLSLDLFTHDPRIQVWALALKLIRQHPWLGVGLGNYKVLYQPQTIPGYDELPHAHNLWLTLAAEAGIPAAIALTTIIGWALYRCVRSLAVIPKQQHPVLLGYVWAFSSLTLLSLFDLTIAYPRNTLLGWFALGVIYAVPALAIRQPWQEWNHPPEPKLWDPLESDSLAPTNIQVSTLTTCPNSPHPPHQARSDQPVPDALEPDVFKTEE